MQTIARDFQAVVIPVSYYERVGETTFNTVAVIDADGTIMGRIARPTFRMTIFIRKSSILRPEIPASRSGIRLMRKSASVSAGTSGSRSPRAGRRGGAGALFLPTAIGSEPILRLRFHAALAALHAGSAAANIMPLIAANRIGTETVKPTEDNQHQSSSLTFYGSSFIADETGALVEQADRENAGVLTHTFDLDEIREMRRSWGVYRDRRPEMYGAMRGYGL